MTTTGPMPEWRRLHVYARQNGQGDITRTGPLSPRQRRRIRHKRTRQQVAEVRAMTAHLSPRETDLTRQGETR